MLTVYYINFYERDNFSNELNYIILGDFNIVIMLINLC